MAKKHLVQQAAILAFVLRSAVLFEFKGMPMRFLGQAISVVEPPSRHQMRSMHGTDVPLAYKGGPEELEHLYLRLSLLDE